MYNLQGKRGLSLAWTVLAVALCLLITMPAGHALADTPPMNFPQTFFGHVTVNGAVPNPAVTVYAKIGDNITQQQTTDSQGRYGYDPNIFAVRGSINDKFDFYVGTTLAQSQVPYRPGDNTPLPLSTTTTNLSVSTGAASNVASTTATLNGTLLNMGGAQSVIGYFQYGTTEQYGQTTAEQTLNQLGLFPANVINRTSGTLYHFRAAVRSGTTTVYGGDQTFQTTSSALTVFTNDASGITGTGATLNGNLADKGTNQSVIVYFEYGNTQQFGNFSPQQTLQTAVAFTYNLTGLMPSTIYYFRAIAIGGSTTVQGAVKSFTTSTSGLAVSTLAATNITANSATLNGSLLAMGGASPINVNFQYGTSTSYSHGTGNVARYSTGTFSADIGSLTPNTTYHFRSAASGGAATGSDLAFTTLQQGSGGGGQYAPNQFYGIVYVGSSAATQGTAVEAWVSGSLAASTSVDTSGRYGYTSVFYVPGTPGSPVTFKVAGTAAPQTATWVSASMTNLNLSISAPAALNVTCSAAYAGTGSATLTGTVTNFGPGDTSAAVSFEWGTSPSSLTTVAATPSPVTYAGQSFTATKTGLTEGTLYYYRAKAVGTSGTVYCPVSGSNEYRHTLAATVATVNSTCSGTTATLNGNLTSMGPYSTGTVLVSFLWGTSSTLATSTETTPTLSKNAIGTYSKDITLPGTGTYYFRAKAIGNATGATAVYGDIQTVSNPATVTVSTVNSTCNGTTATLNGNLTSMGPYSAGTVLVSFLWGTSSPPSTETTPTLSKNAIGTYSKDITLPGTGTYYFRAKAIGNVTGATAVYGDIQTVCGSPVTCSSCIGSTTGLMLRQPRHTAFFAKYPAGSTCSSVNTIYLQAYGSGNARAAIYSDNAGNVGTLLNANNGLTPVSTGTCNAITIGTTSLPAGDYWIAWWMDTDWVAGTYPGTGTVKCLYSTGPSFTFANDSGSGAVTLSGHYGSVSAGTR